MAHVTNNYSFKAMALAIAALTGSASALASVERQQLPLTYIDQAPKVDGVMDEPQWQQATQLPLIYENNPGENVTPVVKTVAYFYEDGENLHVAIKAYDPDPEKIRAYLRDRDTLWQDDNVGIIIDTFNDERSGYEFFVNPLGAQADMRMTDTNGWNEDSSWDAIWDSAGKIDEEGYTVEMSIPFRALRFPENNEEKVWNVAAWRNYPRDIRRSMASNKLDRNLECNLCQFNQLTGLKDINAGKNFQITPTTTVTNSKHREDVTTNDWESTGTDYEAGVDLRWGVTQDMVLNATLNPDFSQVEADSAQLDVNTTFSLFFPEKRPFFLDGSSYFDTNSFNFVHTRNIADPDYGVKLTGKTGDHSYGLMAADDNQTTFLIPGNQGSDIAILDELKSKVTVARYKADVGDRNNVGVMMTDRRADDYSNTLASIDGQYWFDKEDRLTYQFAYSDSKNPQSVQDDFDLDENQSDYAASFTYAHSTRDYNYRIGYTDVGKDFRADLGFHSRTNYKKLVIGGQRFYYGEEGDTLTRWGYWGDWDKTYDQDGNMLEQEIEMHGNLQGPMQSYTNFGIVHRETLWDGEYFNETQYMQYAHFTPKKGMRISGFTRFGKQVDYSNSRLGDVFNIEANADFKIGQHLGLSLGVSQNRMNVDGGRLYTARLASSEIGYQFDMRSRLKLIVQYTDVERNQALYEDDINVSSKNMSTQLLYSYKINPQTLFFLGYSDSGYQDDNLTRIEKTDKSFFAKFSYAWQY